MARLNKYDREHLRKLKAIEKEIAKIYDLACKEAAAIGGSIHDFNPDKPFSFADYSATRARIDRTIKWLEKNVEATVVNGVKAGWDLANKKNDELCSRVFGGNKNRLTDEQKQRYFNNNADALEAFLKRKNAGLNLSDRVWNYTNQFKAEIEMGLDLGIRDGVPAAEMARELKQYLKYPDKLFRRVRDAHGQLHLSKVARAFHPGRGVYRSSFKNARRLAATETNIAYRSSDHERWQQLSFVVGIEVRLSNNHTINGVAFTDMCDDLKGKYPKTFKFTGWHPLCYDELSEVYTDSGWKYFRDVKAIDRILSLNTDTFDLEYSEILLNIEQEYTGKMVHFFNRAIDILVTPDHEMLVLSKQDSRRFRRVPAEKCGKTQPVYRSSEWKGKETSVIEVNGIAFDFNVFCRFMGYWLSDGSLGHKYAVSIAQQDENRFQIYDCIAAMGLKPRFNGGKVEVNCKELYNYLLQFGTCYTKHVPDAIKDAAPYQIKIFLEAFISCDGSVRPPKQFVGNRGSVCCPSECTRVYYTSSPRMAGDIGELILKTGKRPSFRVEKTKGKEQDFRNGRYGINYDEIVIAECSSKTATQYNKEFVDYSGMVYDLKLEKNSTMYIRRNGKCFWGSNCRCHAISVLKSDAEMLEENLAILEGREPEASSVNEVTEAPEGFTSWVEKNQKRIEKAETKGLPYFLKDNRRYWDKADGYLNRTDKKAVVIRGGFSANSVKISKAEHRRVVSNISRLSNEHVIFDRRMPAVELTDTLDGGVMMEWDNGVLRISTNEYDLGKDVGYCPARELVSAFDKLVKGGELSFLEEYSIEALYHENLHPESKGIVKILKNSYQEKIQETCTQLYAREKYGKILRLGYGREPSHFEEIRTEGLGYKENCNLLRDLFSKDGKIQVGELINIVNESQDGLIIVTEKLKWYSRRQIKEFLDQLR